MDMILLLQTRKEEYLLADKERERFASEFWLNYFNDYLFANGLITEDERNKMSNLISRPANT